MADYSDIGLNQFLVPTTNQVSLGGTLNSYDANSAFDAGIISAYNIKNFSFNAGTGGTLTLGGADNANGYLRIVDSGGTQRVLLNNEGVYIYNGSITIENGLGSKIIDGDGLTTYNFKSDENDDADSGTIGYDTTTGTAYTDLPNTLSLQVNKDSKILLLAHTMVRNNDGPTNTHFLINIQRSTDGTTYVNYSNSGPWYLYETTGEEFANTFFSWWDIFDTNTGGSYNYWKFTLQWKVDGGTAYLYDRRLAYLVLGY